MLTRLMVKNFKSIGEPGIDIELRPLTIFVGPNGGGKSSILEALAFLAQNVQNAAPNLRFSGELVTYAAVSSLAHRGDQTRWISFGLFSAGSDMWCRFSFKPDTLEAKEEILRPDDALLLELGLRGDSRRGLGIYAADSQWTSGTGAGGNLNVLDSYFLRQMAIALGYPVETPVSQAEKALEALSKELANNVYLLSGLRGEVYPGISAGQEASWVGRKGEHLLFILSRIASPYYVGVRDNVQKWALEFRMADVWAGYSGGTAISGFYSDPDLEVTLNLASASQGSRQVLGMIAQLFWAKPGSIVMIEEPELSLHPGAQDKLPALFADAIKDGKQVMITTHSHYLLLALTEAVKAGLPAKDIAVYEVRKEPETGTTAKRLEVSNKGHIRGWVSSFAEVDKQLLDRRMGKSGRRASSRTDA